MERVCFQLQVKPERLDEYVRRHAAVWPDMLAALREGRVEIDQDLAAPGFREQLVVELARPDHAPRGRAQAEVLERLRAAGEKFSGYAAMCRWLTAWRSG